MTAGAAPEFSRVIPLMRLGSEPHRVEIGATETERAALAKRFDLVSLDLLSAEIELVRRAGGTFLLRASFTAAFEQSCIVTLEPVAGAVSEIFELLYGPPDDDAAALDTVSADDIAFEPLQADAIDVGEAVAQEFSLALPPFPRRPDADLDTEMPPQERETSPFAALSELVDRGG
ncbi:MAG TPA: DUF177 domain-containing protein [Stellaceae bacterium]|jgi:uncharacterized metal-binding protein YceD (DUF177 family)|nr:DUF177 domain-containing protein [Stellaceae bacterium]